MADAIPLVTDLTWGQMADRVIMTPGVMHGDLMAEAMTMTAKGGTCVVTAVAPIAEMDAAVNLFELAMYNKEIKGTIFGSLNPRRDIPNLLSMYREGQLKLDELVTNTYTPRADQRRLPGHARRQEHPRRRGARLTLLLERRPARPAAAAGRRPAA